MDRDRLKNRSRNIVLSLVYFLLIVGCASTQSKDSTPYVEPSEDLLRVGVSTSAPPLIYKQGKDIVGLEAELAREFADYLGKSVRFIELGWQDQIPALLENRTDIIMSGMSITRMRQIRIAFSEPYFRTGQMALIRRKDAHRYPHGYYSIFGWTLRIEIGVVKGTTGESFVKENFGRAKKIISYQTSKEAADTLAGGEIDMVIHDAPIILMLAAENESKGLVPLPSLLTEEYLAWGVRKNDVELLQSANSFIKTYKKDGRLHEIVNRWIPLGK
jgi:polar amino acid transport system substrate-binding protein